MAKIIVFHFSKEAQIPPLCEAEKIEIREKYDAAIKNYDGVKLHGVFIDSTGKGFCEWEAPSIETVNEIVTLVDGHPPVDGAVIVEKLL